MEFYSHLEPEKIRLKNHLQYVGNRSKEIINSKEFNGMDKDIISDISYLIGISHDFGKYTAFFQEKLKGLKDKNDPLTYHGLISALLAFEVVTEYVKIKNLEDQRPYKFLSLIAYFIVKRHHLDLDDIEDDVDTEKLFDTGFKNINKQLENIWSNKDQIEQEYGMLFQKHHISIEKIIANLKRYEKKVTYSDDIKPLIKELDSHLYFFKKERGKDIIYYLLVQLLYSVLIDSDKKHAGGIRKIERRTLPEDIVETYLNIKEFKEENESNINPIRNEILQSVLKNIRELQDINQDFTLTAPTGTGKTLTALSAALILRKRLKEELKMECEPRIIYSLPFTSIIDQNFDVFDKVLSQIEDFKKYESEYLLKHHYLSEIFYKTKDIDKEKDIDESLALIESWESEIVVTTFIQLFHTLIGYKNRSLKKFHNIVNSIIILDEVQNIPIEYWKLVQEILTAIKRHFNCRIILMTATKPLIFEKGKYKELVDDYEDYFNRQELNRVCLKIDSDEKQISEFCNSLDDWSKNSYLFVLNTINSSMEFYNILSENKTRHVETIIINKGSDKEKKIKTDIFTIKKDGEDFEIYCLSTNIIPKTRRERIEIIKNRLDEGKRIIIISTQLIEAGVDIDCDCVYRDMGPLDSIIQVAGRCNRNKRLEQSDMHILNLVSEDNKPFTGIYDPVLIGIVKQIFKDKSQILESEFLELINDFFEMAKSKLKVETKLIDSIYELYFYDKAPNDTKRIPISEFKLIKEDYFKVDVFIELDDDAKETWERHCEIKKIKNLIERKKEFLKIKKDFYEYVISVPEKYKNQVGFNEKVGIGRITKTEIDRGLGYDLTTGFKRKDGGSGTLFC